jgi:SAM-dependent methyltransferase
MPNAPSGLPPHPHDDEVRTFWDAVADDWRIQVGRKGDKVRRFSSDPVLWDLLGDVRGKSVLDAGCGTGYLSAQLRDRGARVTGVDISTEMTAIARADHPDIDFRAESVTALPSFDDEAFDALVANYVLMDVPDLDAAVRTFHRVLRPGGVAVLVFSHPCFPQGRREESADGATASYAWDFPYFEEPRIAPERHASVPSQEMLRKLRERPYSVAFKLRR